MIKFKKLLRGVPLSLIFLSLVLTNCAEKKEIKYLANNIQRVKKSWFKADGETRWIFGETISNMPIETGHSMYPGYQNFYTKMIRFEFTEKHLNVIAVTPYSSSAIHDLNTSTASEKIISSFPITKHCDIWLQEDDYGDKTNQQTETDELGEWWQREYAIIDFGAEKVIDRTGYSEEYRSYYGNIFAVQNSEGEIIDLELEDDIINMTLLKTMPTGNPYDNPLIEVKYSFLLDSGSDYLSKEYPIEWEKKMGYFKTDVYIENEYGMRERKTYMNRWNPSKQITYYLSESWNYPHNVKYKHVAYKAIERWNTVFEKATGIPNYIILKESDGTQKLGDLRYNIIQWIDESLSSGPLGYGPSVAHPETGEIINANTIVYGGALRSQIWRTKLLANSSLTSHPSELNFTSGDSSVEGNTSSGTKDILSKLLDESNLEFNNENLKISNQFSSSNLLNHKQIIDAYYNYNTNSFLDIPKLKKDLQEYNKEFQEMVDLKKKSLRQNAQSHGCYYPMPEIKLHEAIHNHGMSDDEVAEELLIGVLTHELGHNFGLRHNFRGSIDKDNFWGARDGEEEFHDHEGKPKLHSASVMDYENNFGHELDRPGRYDETTIINGYSMDPLPAKVDFPFEYCTDEGGAHNGGKDAYCLVFDRGTSAKEITENLGRDFHDYYRINNLPIPGIKRYAHSSLNSYLTKVISRYMIPMRRFADYRQYRYQQLFEELGRDEEAVKVHPEIIDLNEAVINSFHFLASCLYNDKQDLDTIDDYTSEVLVRGIIYDKMYASLFLTLESLGSWGYNFTSVTTYPDLFNKKYFKKRGFSEEKFFEIMAQAPSGWFNKYSFENKGEGFIIPNQKGKNMMRPELRTQVIENLLRNMNNLGSSSKNYTIIGAKNIYNDSQLAEFENSTLNSFQDKLISVIDSGMTNKDFHIANLNQLSQTLQSLLATLPVDPGGELSEEHETLYSDAEKIRSDLEFEIGRLGNPATLDTIMGDIAAIDGTESPEAITSLANRMQDVIFNSTNAILKYKALMPKVFDSIKNSRFQVDSKGYIILDEEGNPVISPASKTFDKYFRYNELFQAYLITKIINSARGVLSEYEKVSLSLTAGLYEDAEYTRIYDSNRKKMIIVPKNSSITSLVAQNHSNFREMLDLLIKIYDLSQSNDPLELRLSKTLMDVNGIEDENQLETYISIYDDFLNREKDMLYEMFDLYTKYVPGQIWN